MPDNETFGNSGISDSSFGQAKYHYDPKSKTHIITTKGGTVIKCKTQSEKNEASIYLINANDAEMLSLENISGASIIALGKVKTTLSLVGCNNCFADMSQNSTFDDVSIYDDKFKSKNNTVKIDGSDNLSFTDDSGKEIDIHTSGKYNEGTLKKESNSLWHRIFGFSKAD